MLTREAARRIIDICNNNPGISKSHILRNGFHLQGEKCEFKDMLIVELSLGYCYWVIIRDSTERVVEDLFVTSLWGDDWHFVKGNDDMVLELRTITYDRMALE